MDRTGAAGRGAPPLAPGCKLAGRLDGPVAAERLGLACYQNLNFGLRIGLSEEEIRTTVAQCRDSAAPIVRALCASAEPVR